MNEQPAPLGFADGSPVGIADADGRLLTEAIVRLAETPHCLDLADLGDPGALLEQYFGRGEARVMVAAGERWPHGRVETCWQGGGRRWRVEIETPAPVDELPPAPASRVGASEAR